MIKKVNSTKLFEGAQKLLSKVTNFAKGNDEVAQVVVGDAVVFVHYDEEDETFKIGVNARNGAKSKEGAKKVLDLLQSLAKKENANLNTLTYDQALSILRNAFKDKKLGESVEQIDDIDKEVKVNRAILANESLERFVCAKCNEVFESFVPQDKREAKVECPHCSAKLVLEGFGYYDASEPERDCDTSCLDEIQLARQALSSALLELSSKLNNLSQTANDVVLDQLRQEVMNVYDRVNTLIDHNFIAKVYQALE